MKQKTPTTQREFAEEIIKRIDSLSSSGHRRYEVFDDFLKLVEVSLEALPRHFTSAKENGTLAEDTDEAKSLFSSVRDRYGRDGDKRLGEYMTLFSEAIGLLMMSADVGMANHEYMDVPGETYMLLEVGNVHIGQYFTPIPIARMMADITMQNVEEEVHKRIKDALSHPDNPLGQAALLTSMVISDDSVQKYFYDTVLPAAAPFYTPILVNDQCVGSGVMLLAAASSLPSWITKLGLVQFYGQDIDERCVRMCRINIMLYGLNGTHIRYFRDLTAEDISSIPEPYSSLYKRAQEEPENIIEVTNEFNGMRQLSLF